MKIDFPPPAIHDWEPEDLLAFLGAFNARGIAYTLRFDFKDGSRLHCAALPILTPHELKTWKRAELDKIMRAWHLAPYERDVPTQTLRDALRPYAFDVLWVQAWEWDGDALPGDFREVKLHTVERVEIEP